MTTYVLFGAMVLTTAWAAWAAGRYQALRREEEERIETLAGLVEGVAKTQAGILVLTRRVTKLERTGPGPGPCEVRIFSGEGEEDHEWN